jgi:hypothetical protein
MVQTPKNIGKVVDVQVLTQLVVVQTENGERQAWPVDQIKILKGQPAPASEDQTPPPQEEEGGPIETLEDDLSASPESPPETEISPVDEEAVFNEMEEVFEESRQLRDQPSSGMPGQSENQAPNRPDAGSFRPQGQPTRPDPSQNPNQDDRPNKKRRKNRRGRNRHRRPQNGSNSNQPGRPNNPNNSNNSNNPSGSSPA